MVLAWEKMLHGREGRPAVREGENGVERKCVACCPATPALLDDRLGVDQRPIHVEQHRLATYVDRFFHGSLVRAQLIFTHFAGLTLKGRATGAACEDG